MKGMADALGDLSEVIQDRTLVLNILRGLSPKYNHMKALLKRSRPFPTFSEVCNDLILEELIMAPPSSQPPTALLATQKKAAALVLNILRGLSPKYNHMKALLKRSRPFPTFSEVCNDLILEELIMAPPSSQPPTALLATQKKAAAPGASQALPVTPHVLHLHKHGHSSCHDVYFVATNMGVLGFDGLQSCDTSVFV
jgi:hypothetical protein